MSQQITITNFFKGRVGYATVLNYVEQKLIEQGKQSTNTDGCLYRSNDGCKCAIGHIIPDSRYLAEFDDIWIGGTIENLMTNEEYRKHLGIDHIKDVEEFNNKLEFLIDIQMAHDSFINNEIITDDMDKKQFYNRNKQQFISHIKERFDKLHEKYHVFLKKS